MKQYISIQIHWKQKSSTFGVFRLLLYNFHIKTNECSFGAQKSCSSSLCCIKILYLFFHLSTYTIFIMLVRISLIIFLKAAIRRIQDTWTGILFVWFFSLCVFRMNFGFVNLCDCDTKNERLFTIKTLNSFLCCYSLLLFSLLGKHFSEDTVV